jgi:hypothetical protein
MGVLSTMSSIHNTFPFSQNLNKKGKKNNEKKQKNKKNEQSWTLVYTLVLQTMEPVSFFFFSGSKPIDFLSKMKPCKLKSQLDLSWSWTFV